MAGNDTAIYMPLVPSRPFVPEQATDETAVARRPRRRGGVINEGPTAAAPLLCPPSSRPLRCPRWVGVWNVLRVRDGRLSKAEPNTFYAIFQISGVTDQDGSGSHLPTPLIRSIFCCLSRFRGLRVPSQTHFSSHRLWISALQLLD